MATGAEMAITQGLKLAMKAAGIKPEQVEHDVVRLVSAVLSWDARLAALEQNQTLIMRHLGVSTENDEHGKNGQLIGHG